MKNSKCRIGRKAQAARRIAGLLVSGTLAGTLAAGGAGAVTATAATWSENADYIFEYLTQELGYTEAAACGIMANIRCESTFNPHAWNAGGGSYGLCQWTGGRYGRLQSWCRSNGYDYTTIDGQLAYLEYELNNHYPGVEAYLRSVENTQDGAYDAGQYYCYHFEAPASRGSVSVYRGGLASGTFWDSYRPAEWYQVDGVWHYILRDGSYQTDWLTIDDETFFFDNDGNRISGWRSVDGERYYFDEDGVMATGWKKIDGRSYYFGEDGSLITGVLRDGEDWYLLDDYGNVQASAAMKEFAPVWIASAAEESAQEETSLASAEAESAEDMAEDSEVRNETSVASSESSPAEDKAQAAAAQEETDSASVQEADPQPAVSAPIPFALGSAQKKDEGAGAPLSLLTASAGQEEEADGDTQEEEKLSSVEQLLRAAEQAEETQETPEDDYLAAAQAMQAAAMSADEDASGDEDSSGALPAGLPGDSIKDLTLALPEFKENPLVSEEHPAMSASVTEEQDADDEEAEEIPGPVWTAEPAQETEEDTTDADTEDADADTEDGDADTESGDVKESDPDTESGSEKADEDDAEAGSDQEDETEESDGGSTEDNAADEKDSADKDTEKEEKDSSGKDETADAGGTSEQADQSEEDENHSEDGEAAEDSKMTSDLENSDKETSGKEATDKEASDEEVSDEDEKKDEDQEIRIITDVEDDEENQVISSARSDGDEDKPSISLHNADDFLSELGEKDLEDTDKLLRQLREEDVLRAESGSGDDITEQVKVSVEQDEDDERLYIITFSVEHKGETTELSIEHHFEEDKR